MANLEQRVALVSGGAQGIGKAIAKRFHAVGSSLIVVDTCEAALLELASELDRNIITCVATCHVGSVGNFSGADHRRTRPG